jgi:hypothetical protein
LQSNNAPSFDDRFEISIWEVNDNKVYGLDMRITGVKNSNSGMVVVRDVNTGVVSYHYKGRIMPITDDPLSKAALEMLAQAMLAPRNDWRKTAS